MTLLEKLVSYNFCKNVTYRAIYLVGHGCTYPAKDTTENVMFQKSALLNDKCNFNVSILIYSQKSDLFTYFEKRIRVLHKGTVLSKL